MPLDPQVVPIVEAARNAPGPAMHELTPEKAREVAGAGMVPAPREEVGQVVDRTIPGPGGEIPVRIYTPEGDGPFGLLVYYHGSGFVIFDLDSHDGECRALCRRAGVVVVSVDYRLAPEHKFPAGPDDAWAALEWAAANATELGADPARLGVAGDSAGGCLAAVTAQTARDRGGPELSLQVLIYPVTDCRAGHPSYEENAEGYVLGRDGMHWFINHYIRSEADKLDPRCSPILAEDFSGLAPALVITAEYDPLRDEGEDYARKLLAAGVPTTLTRYDGQIHGAFQMRGILDAGERMLEQAAGAVREALGSRA